MKPSAWHLTAMNEKGKHFSLLRLSPKSPPPQRRGARDETCLLKEVAGPNRSCRSAFAEEGMVVAL